MTAATRRSPATKYSMRVASKGRLTCSLVREKSAGASSVAFSRSCAGSSRRVRRSSFSCDWAFSGGFRAFGGICLRDAVVQARCGGSTSEFLAKIPDSADKIALPGLSQRKALPALKYQLNHAAGFGSFHAGKTLLPERCRSRLQKCINRRELRRPAFCFHKRDFQLFALQPAAQGFQGFPGFQVRLVRRSALVASLSNLSREQVCLEGKNRA